MEERRLDLVLVPLGLVVMACYHLWLLYEVLHHPNRTIIGLNADARRRWIETMMADPMKNGVLAVQTLRNNIMASTLLATVAATLASLVTVVVSATTSTVISPLVYGSKSSIISSVKFFSITLCYILAFLCNVQAIRYYSHVSFLVTLSTTTATSDGRVVGAAVVSTDYVARSLNRGSYFWSLGLRAFYVSFALFLWIFGPIPMLAYSVVICCLLYFLDTPTESTRDLHHSSFRVPELPPEVKNN